MSKTTKTAAGVSTGKKDQAIERELNRQNDTVADSASKFMAMSIARSRFVSASAGLAWRMAIAVLVPVIVGVQIDKHFKTSPSYTLGGIFLGVGLSAMIIWKTVKQISADQTTQDLAIKPIKKGVKHA